jgi:hypothetical protein
VSELWVVVLIAVIFDLALKVEPMGLLDLVKFAFHERKRHSE